MARILNGIGGAAVPELTGLLISGYRGMLFLSIMGSILHLENI
jgi:hypothetical protein